MKSVFIFFILIFLVLQPFVFSSEGKWTGVDETVVEKYAKEQGREAREPLINTDQGDLLLFIFLVAGAVAGFMGGYYWRVLIDKRPSIDKKEQK